MPEDRAVAHTTRLQEGLNGTKEENRSAPVSRGSGARWLSSSAGSLSLNRALVTERRAGIGAYYVVPNGFIPAPLTAYRQDLRNSEVYRSILNGFSKRKIPPCFPTRFGKPFFLPHSSSFWYHSPSHKPSLPPSRGRTQSPQSMPSSVFLASARQGSQPRLLTSPALAAGTEGGLIVS